MEDINFLINLGVVETRQSAQLLLDFLDKNNCRREFIEKLDRGYSYQSLCQRTNLEVSYVQNNCVASEDKIRGLLQSEPFMKVFSIGKVEVWKDDRNLTLEEFNNLSI